MIDVGIRHTIPAPVYSAPFVLPLVDLAHVPSMFPRNDPSDAPRFASIEAARRDGATLPPIIVARLRGVSYLQDGHHRLHVARRYGDREITAIEITNVNEIVAAYPEKWSVL